jgi:hypothetical protein
MQNNDLLKKIADKNVNIAEFAKMVIDDDSLRAEIVKQLLTNKNIMVYYHCYSIIDQASAEQPEFFYQYWDNFSALLHHQNSYHRDIGLTITANLTAVDSDRRFPGIIEDYLNHINDPKFMTALCMVRNTKKIIRNQPDLRKCIIDFLIGVDNRCSYPDKQKALLKCDIIEVLDEVYRACARETIQDQKRIKDFVRSEINSISPKTRKSAKDFTKKHGC